MDSGEKLSENIRLLCLDIYIRDFFRRILDSLLAPFKDKSNADAVYWSNPSIHRLRPKKELDTTTQLVMCHIVV